ncbi:Uu.00g013530.m01.CDS01 [Anthostomella pinea]|uniref:Uu.00g013530.m01.CDS01 n=1 Tax=Anthostomella pinea TaxID=933095 RepID=A0AAI8YQ64_9PEZI|nr:Uu.00g013530.m01.CDS01 [Anthostomella pinea]
MGSFLMAALPSTLLSLLLLSGSSLVSATVGRSACLRRDANELAEAVACGDKGSLRYCFTNVPAYLEQSDVEQCFQNAGCGPDEARIETQYVVKVCDEGQSVAEIRRRGPDPTPAPIPMPAPQSGAAITTTVKGGALTTVQCSTSTTLHTSMCPIAHSGPSSGQELPCYPTDISYLKCAHTNHCSVNDFGVNICKLKNDELNAGQLVVTIILAAVAALGVLVFMIFCIRDKRAQKALRVRKEADEIAKTQAAMGARPNFDMGFDAPSHSISAGDPFSDAPRH